MKTEISDSEFRTYAVLKSFKHGSHGRVFPSVATVSSLRGKKSRAIINHLNKLRQVGLIFSKRRGYSASNEYHFIGEENCTSLHAEGDRTVVQSSASQKSMNLQGNNTTANKTETNNSFETDEVKKRRNEKMTQIREKLPFLLKKISN